MSYAPASLLTLRTYLQTKTGLGAISLGIVGNTAHVRGYHLGRDRIFSSKGSGWNDYSVKTARDKDGLTNAAMAMDIGNFPRLRSLSIWLVAQCRANAVGTRDIREIIFSPDGITVLRYDRERGINSVPRPGEADNSHRTHTHISWYRDSQARNKVDLFKRYFDPVSTEPKYIAAIEGRTQTYNSLGQPLGEISGLTVKVAERIKILGLWHYKIVPPYKYAGRYLRATSTVTYTPI